MHIYELRYREGRGKPERTVSFRGDQPSTAFLLAQRVKCAGPAELWRDGTKLCGLERTTVGAAEVWLIHPGEP